MVNNNLFSVFFVWKTPYMFSLMKKNYNSGPTCRKHWHDHRQMEYAKYNKCHHISDFISFLLCAVSQVRCRWDGGIWIMEREPARDDIISLKVEPSTVAIAQETEKHKPDQHLTHSTSVMSYSETWAFKTRSSHQPTVSPYSVGGKDLHAMCNYHGEKHLPEICYQSF